MTRFLLPHSVDESADRFPDHDAFRCDGQRLTYAQLAGSSNQLANTLRELRVKKGDRVGILMDRSLESAIAVYGVMKAGAAFVPLDPAAPAERHMGVIGHCGIKVVIGEHKKRKAARSIIEAGASLNATIGLREPAAADIENVSWDEVKNASSHAQGALRIVGDDLAYVMFTSGSTGAPKGIMHTHYSGLSYARLSAQTYHITRKDRISGHSPLHFDMSTLGYFTGPLASATTVLIPEAYTKLPASLSQLIEREAMTVWYSVPFALTQLLLRGVLDERDCSSLRWVLFGGEPFPVKHLQSLMEKWPHARFGNVYGPAEVNQCTYYHVPADQTLDESGIPIGTIWPDTEALVVDEEDQEVEAGQPGELLIRTSTMMKGYWDRPDLNEKAFFIREAHPGFSLRFYRTGDLVSVQEDGLYRFLGRKDRQVKTRGYRVELDEVEAVLLALPDVEEAAVFTVADADGSRQIEAAVIPRPGQHLTTNDIKTHATSRLPWYAVPQRVFIEATFPRTTSGKIDRRALQLQASTSHQPDQ